jgi:hypothetical protein
MATDLSMFKQDNKNVLEKVAGEGEKKVKKKVGRTPKNPDERLTEKVMLNFTKAEKDKLLSIAKGKGNLPLTSLIRNVLKENDYI